tara:strand:- start:1089 stop:1748 length:660 start_codon:yes stop_codon:yes gene_type:complete
MQILNKPKLKISILNYQMNNLYSINNALVKLNYKTNIINDPEEIKYTDILILPGVGAFGNAMKQLKSLNLIDSLLTYVSLNKPLIAICLGMQLLFKSSSEFYHNEGLGIFEGKVRSFKDLSNVESIPHVGWNEVMINKENNHHKIGNLKKKLNSKYYYFVHSFYCDPINKNEVLTNTKYFDFTFCSSVIKKNIIAFQFHPEKSGLNGLSLIDSFIKEKF